MLESQIPTASEYNSIKRFEEQIHTLEPEILQDLGELFVRHRMHSCFGVGLLHRHGDLEEDHVMVHSTPDPNTDVCKMERLDPYESVELTPCSFYLNAGHKFQPFEYDRLADRSAPSEDFLRDLRSFLYHHDLSDSIAIFSITSFDKGLLVEYLLPEGSGTIAFQHQADDDLEARSNGVVTGWSFIESNGVVKYKARMKCDPHGSGGHTVS